MIELSLDTLRVGHMLSFAIGIGAALFLELQVTKRFIRGVEIEGLRMLLSGHTLIKYALFGLWLTGLGLVFMRVVILCEMPSAKMIAKLTVVTLLTANMRIIDRFVLPELFVYEGLQLADIPAKVRAQLGAVAGFSAGCWASALLLGGFGRLAMMDGLAIASFLVPIIAFATACGAIVGFAAGMKRGLPQRDPWKAVVPGE
ncbi:MAG: hypothetical protein AAGA87_07640 [Pseudomonadota bacterium]